jgi:aspartate/methionine/tyrosine aminotransferase
MAKFPANDIISLLDRRVPYNLGESTSRDLVLGELIDAELPPALAGLSLGYGTSRGDAALRAFLAEEAGVAPDDVLITPGGAAGLFLLTFTCCDPGDEVVTTAPNFPPTLDVITAVGCELRRHRLAFDRGYHIDPEALRADLSPATRLVVLVTPHNPSGVAIAPAHLRALVDTILTTCPEATLVIDETYREATYGDQPAPATAASLSLSPRVLVISSLSKALGAPGLRIGWLICRDRQLMDELLRAKMNMVISCSVVDEALALEVLRRKQHILAERRAMLQRAVARVARWVEAHGQNVEWVRPDGGALCCVRLRPDVHDQAAVARFHAALPDHGVMVGRGPWFDEDDRVFRLGFGYLPLEQLDRALDALSDALASARRDRAG